MLEPSAYEERHKLEASTNFRPMYNKIQTKKMIFLKLKNILLRNTHACGNIIFKN